VGGGGGGGRERGGNGKSQVFPPNFTDIK
jgi:hypothetical protein